MAMYLIITEEFALENNDFVNGCNKFSSAVTNDGIYVTSPNAIIEFPELFEGKNFPSVELGLNSFPPPPEE
jgi:hypothetical protein